MLSCVARSTKLAANIKTKIFAINVNTRDLKPQSHRAHDQITTYLRPNVLDSWANRRKNERLVAEVVGDRQGKISRIKVVVMFKTPTQSPSHTGLTTRLRPTSDWKMLESWANRRKNVRLVGYVILLVAEVVGDRKGKINRSTVDGQYQNC